MGTKNNKSALAVSYCDFHQKLSYSTKARAKKSARLHTEHLNVFRCTENEQLWHLGHLAPEVIKGHIDRGTYYGKWAS